MSTLGWYAVLAVHLCMLEHVFSQTLYNSTLACTRGANQTYLSIDCRDVYPDGATRVMSISRVFFGATPATSGCSRTAPYSACCVRDPNNPDCTFPVDAELQQVVDRCAGTSYCSFPGKRLATSVGNCDQTLYPDMTSFAFVEYKCTGQLATLSTPPVSTTMSTSSTSTAVLSSSTPIATPFGAILNSSLACTRGAVQTNHNLDCRNQYQDGDNRSLSIVRVFYGTTPLSSGCDRTAPYANCCVRDPNKPDCVFQNDVELQKIVEKCSGTSYCEFSGLRVSSSLGNCDPNNYPSLTSFSFIEYQCLPRQVTSAACSDVNDRQVGRIYLESNAVVVGRTVTDTTCQCLITTDCDSSLSFYGIVVQLTQINATTCSEEITFADVRYPQFSARVNCTDDDKVLYNKSLFTSVSNAAIFQFRVSGQQQGKFYIRAQSSVNTSNVTLVCGTLVAPALNQIQQCPNQTTTTPLPTPLTRLNATTAPSATPIARSSTTTTPSSTSIPQSSTTTTPSSTSIPQSSTTSTPSTTSMAQSSTTTTPSTTSNAQSSTITTPSATSIAQSSTTTTPSTTIAQFTITTTPSTTPSTQLNTTTTPATTPTTQLDTTITPSTTPTAQSMSTAKETTDGSIFNSTLACTRDADQTNHNLDCRNHYQDGNNRSLSIVRVFYGATLLSSGCNRTAPYANCCVRDPNKLDCVFQNDAELQEIIEKCSGNSYCEFSGLRLSSSLGNCDPNNYPSLTSFSFIEYQCLPRQVTGQTIYSTETSTVATDATSSMTTSQTTSAEGDGSSSQLGGVRLFDAGTIVGIIFGVLGVTILIFIVILICGRYNKKCLTSSSDSDITILPDGKIGPPKSRLWVKDKWAGSFY